MWWAKLLTNAGSRHLRVTHDCYDREPTRNPVQGRNICAGCFVSGFVLLHVLVQYCAVASICLYRRLGGDL